MPPLTNNISKTGSSQKMNNSSLILFLNINKKAISVFKWINAKSDIIKGKAIPMDKSVR